MQFRKWLNRDISMRAHVIGRVEVNDGSIYSELDIGDCNRNITLDFSIYGNLNDEKESRKEYRNNLEKLNRLLESVTKMRDAYIEAEALTLQNKEK